MSHEDVYFGVSRYYGNKRNIQVPLFPLGMHFYRIKYPTGAEYTVQVKAGSNLYFLATASITKVPDKDAVVSLPDPPIVPVAPEGELEERFVIGEVPIGLINGQNATFQSVYDFVPGTVELFSNGLSSHGEFTTSGTRTVTLSFSPLAGESLHLNYLRKD